MLTLEQVLQRGVRKKRIQRSTSDSWNHLTNDALEVIADHLLQKSFRSILLLMQTSKDMKREMERVVRTRITRLDLSNCSANIRQAITWCERIDNLKTLVIQGGAAGIAATALLDFSLIGQLDCLHIESKHIADSAVENLAPALKNIKELNMNKCHKLTDRSAIALARNCPLLEVFRAADWHGLSDIAIETIAACCPKLRVLVVDGARHLTRASIQALQRFNTHPHAPTLSELSLFRCISLDDESLRAVHNLPLSTLIVGCNTFLSTPGFNFLSMLRNISRLELTSLRGLDDTAVSTILSNIGTSVRSLSLARCPGITDRSCLEIAAHCKDLHTLRLEKTTITDVGLLEIAAHLNHLKTYSTVWCTKTTDAAHTAIIRGNPNLTKILIEACYLISDAALAEMQSLRSLRTLNIRLCSKLSLDAIIGLARSTPLEKLSLGGVTDDAGTRVLVSTILKMRPECRLLS